MTRVQLENLLKTLNVPVYYDHTTKNTPQTLPFIVYLDDGSNNMMADNHVYQEIMGYQIIIHSATRNEVLESQLKTILSANMIPYEINDIDWDEDIYLWKTVFVISLVNGSQEYSL